MTDDKLAFDDRWPDDEPPTARESQYRVSPDRSGSATSRAAPGYRHARPPTSERTCGDCGRRIPLGQRACDHCLNRHVGSSPRTDDTAAETSFVHAIFVVVTSSTAWGATAKAAAAGHRLGNHVDDPIDDCQFVADLPGAPAEPLTQEWGDLPPAVRLDSDDGQRLLRMAIDRTAWVDDTTDSATEHAPPRGDGDPGNTDGDTTDTARSLDNHATYLYDDTGTGIRSRDRLSDRRREATTPLWLVPALGLTAADDRPARGSSSSAGDREGDRSLGCEACETATPHAFRAHEEVPVDVMSGQPIWVCQRCGAARYGPDPAADS